MSFTYNFPEGKNCTLIVGRGQVTVDECIDVLKRVLADPRCSPESAALIDIRGLTYVGNTTEILELAGSIEEMSTRFKGNIAVVARGATLLAAEILAAHVRTMEHIRMKVFVKMSAARAFSRC